MIAGALPTMQWHAINALQHQCLLTAVPLLVLPAGHDSSLHVLNDLGPSPSLGSLFPPRLPLRAVSDMCPPHLVVQSSGFAACRACKIEPGGWHRIETCRPGRNSVALHALAEGPLWPCPEWCERAVDTYISLHVCCRFASCQRLHLLSLALMANLFCSRLMPKGNGEARTGAGTMGTACDATRARDHLRLVGCFASVLQLSCQGWPPPAWQCVRFHPSSPFAGHCRARSAVHTLASSC